MPPYSPAAAPSSQFGNPVHCVKIAKDGLVYICDRVNDRAPKADCFKDRQYWLPDTAQ
jgi:hypothetical protein